MEKRKKVYSRLKRGTAFLLAASMLLLSVPIQSVMAQESQPAPIEITSEPAPLIEETLVTETPAEIVPVTETPTGVIQETEPSEPIWEDEGYQFSFHETNKSNEAITQDIYWIDNNNAQGNRLAASEMKEVLYNKGYLTAQVTVKYTIDGEEKTFTYQMPINYKDLIASDSIEITDLGGTGHYVLNIKGNVFPKIQVTSPGSTTATEIDTKNVTWTLLPQKIEGETDEEEISEIYENYWIQEVNKDNEDAWPGAGGNYGWYFVEAMDYEVNVEVRRGEDRISGIYKAIGEKYHFYVDTGREDGVGNINLALSDSRLEGSWDAEKGYGTTPGSNKFTVKHLPKYNLDASEIQYYIDCPEGENDDRIDSVITDGKEYLPGDDYLKETVENDTVYNYGTDTERVHNGGKLILTRTGYTGYEATKYWEDDADPSNRPQVDFELWRVTKKGENFNVLYKTASPVKDENTAKTATITIEKNSTGDSQTFNFEEIFGENPDSEEEHFYLPKYDPDGYPYIYLTREYMGEGGEKYRTEFGHVDPNSNVIKDDTLPEGVTVRDAQDSSIYNGGAVSNILTGTTQVSATKIWYAAAFQSELSDVRVELKLQYKENDGTWKDVEPEQTVEIKDFYAETLEQTISETMPKYDNQGHALQYRFIESAIYQGETEIPIIHGDDPSTGRFILTQNGNSVEYTSKFEIEGDAEQGYHTTITNEIVDQEEYLVRKIWEEKTTPETIYLQLTRTDYKLNRNKLVTEDGKEIPLTGKPGEKIPLYLADEKGENPDLEKIAGYAQEYAGTDGSWYLYLSELEKYDIEGHPYDFLVLEKKEYESKWDVEYERGFYTVAEDGREIPLMTITNKPPGEGKKYRIQVRKRWLDDGDVQHREPVTFSVFKKEENGTYTKIEKYETIVEAKDGWWKQIEIYKEDVELDDLLVLETKVGGHDVEFDLPEDVPEFGYGYHLTYKEKEYLDQIFDIQQNNKTTSSDKILYKATNHYYYCDYAMSQVDDVWFLVATNHRLGIVNADATKKWIDGDGGNNGNNKDNENNENTENTENTGKREALRQAVKDALENQEYELGLQLVLTGEVDDYRIDYAHDTVIINGIERPILDSEGNPGQAIVPLNVENDTEDFSFYNLPKYNMYGEIVRYEIREVAYIPNQRPTDTTPVRTLSDLMNDPDYQKYFKDIDYTIHKEVQYIPAHGTDSKDYDEQKYTVTNRLNGTKDVTFGKLWKDAFRYKQGERPDIYLELYYTEHYKDANGIVQERLMPIYVDSKWKFYEGDINVATTTLPKMQKYDSLGYERIYYAQEIVKVDKEHFDYTDVEYMHNKDAAGGTGKPFYNEYEVVGKENGFLSGYGNEKEWSENVLKNISEGSEPPLYVLQENGIFFNKIQADIKVKGKKIWANLPSGFLKADLPAVDFQLYQLKEGDIAGDNINVPTDADGNQLNAFATVKVANWNDHLFDGEYQFAMEYKGTNINEKKSSNQNEGSNENESNKELVVKPGESESGDSEAASKIPKYDDEGNLYNYVLRETMADGFPLDSTKLNLVFKQPVINNYAIQNVYNPQLGELKIKKWLDKTNDIKNLGKNPTITFTLTRKYKKNGEEEFVEDQNFSKTGTINQGTFKTDPNDSNNKLKLWGELTFNELPIYAPNGEKYVYAVTENEGQDEVLKGGYQVFSAQGELTFDAEIYKENQKTVEGLYPKPSEKTDESLDEDEEPDVSCATFKNVYELAPVKVTFNKRWNDIHNYANMRPKTFRFTIYRGASNQPGSNNTIAQHEVAYMEVTIPDDGWTKEWAADEEIIIEIGGENFKKYVNIEQAGAEQDTYDNFVKQLKKVTVRGEKGRFSPFSRRPRWFFTLESVDGYAPNGMPWYYVFTENHEKLEKPYFPSTGWKSSTARLCRYAKDLEDFDPEKDDPNRLVEIYADDGQNIANNFQITTNFEKEFSSPIGQNIGLKNTLGYDVRLDATLYVHANITDSTGATETVGWKKYEESEYAYPIYIFRNQQYQDTKEDFDKWIENSGPNPNGNFLEMLTATHPSHTYKKGENFTATQFMIKETLMPAYRTPEGNVVWFQYAFLEDSVTLLDGDKEVYKQTFEPTFVEEDGEWSYYFTTKSQIMGKDDKGNDEWKETKVNIFQPVIDTEEKRRGVLENGGEAIGYGEAWDDKKLPTVQEDLNTDKKLIGYKTFNANTISFTELKVEKIWGNDDNNSNGTRDNTNDGSWSLKFQVQRRDKTETDDKAWKKVPDTVSKDITITAKDEVDSKIAMVTNLPVYGIEKMTDGGGYEVAEYDYRAREYDINGTVLEKKSSDTDNDEIDRYNGIYDVIYEDTTTDNSEKGFKYITSVTNCIGKIKRYAEKQWDIPEGISHKPVTLELQYLKSETKEEDGPTKQEWASFATPKKIVLNGIKDSEEDPKPNKEGFYEEYEAWKASWKEVPKVVPNSYVKDGESVFRIVEYSENGWETTSGTTGTGKADDPYILSGISAQGGISDTTPVIYKNELTQMKVEKVVLGDADNTEFTFTFTAPEGDTAEYQWQKYQIAKTDNDDEKLTGDGSSGTVKSGGTLELKGNQYLLIYGLKKGAVYSVKETDSKGYEPFVQVTDENGNLTDENGSLTTDTGSITIPEQYPGDGKIPTIKFTNKNKSQGKITILKKDEKGNLLDGVTFTLSKEIDSGNKTEWKVIEEKTTGEDGNPTGQVVFDNLELDMKYQIKEIETVEGKMLLAEPIELVLPYKTATKSEGQTSIKEETEGDTTYYYYAEITLEVVNNQPFVIPSTSGRTIFWPGIVLLGCTALILGGYIWQEEKKRRRKKHQTL